MASFFILEYFYLGKVLTRSNDKMTFCKTLGLSLSICNAKCYRNIPKVLKIEPVLLFFKILTLAEPQPMTNDISQSHVRPYDTHEIMMFLVKNVVTYENVICPINAIYENV